MDNNLTIAVIAAGSAIIGSLAGGLINYYSSKKSLDREDRRRREELERKTADERLKKLYIPLLKIMSPSPPYDDGLNFDRRNCGLIMDLIKTNEMIASPELIHKYYEFTNCFYNNPEQINFGLDWELFNIVASEYDELKNILGYGSILRKPSKVKIVLNKLLSPILRIIKETSEKINYKIILWRRKKKKKIAAVKIKSGQL